MIVSHLSSMDLAVQAAIYRPLLGRSTTTAAMATILAMQLHDRWHVFLEQLLEEASGLDAASAASLIRLSQAGHACWPDYGCKSRKGRPTFCRRRKLCPFCWSRDHVRRAYRWAVAHLLPARAAGFWLLAFQSRSMIMAPPDGPKVVRYHAVFRAARAAIKAGRRQETRRLPAAAGLILHQVVPQQRGVTVCRGGLLLLTSPTALPKALQAAGVRLQLYQHYDRALFAKLLGHLCRYPAGLLRLPADAVVAYLEELHGVRLWTGMAPRRSGGIWDDEES